jgi:tRNA threonylcarbamoyladenosine biosynthesis protein TsaE
MTARENFPNGADIRVRQRWWFLSQSPEQTLDVGRQVGRLVEPPFTIGLIGTLGTGKTVFVRGLAEGLGIDDPRNVCSPTFILMQVYDCARCRLYHLDPYRLPKAEDCLALGIEELFDQPVVLAVEWADRLREYLPEDRLEVEVAHLGPQERSLTFQAQGPRSLRLLQAVLETMSQSGRVLDATA